MEAATETAPRAQQGGLDRFFKISERGSNLRLELLGGLTTFLTMSYILFVNPAILSTKGTGLAFNAVAVATALAAFIATLAMGLFTNYPFALASGLGLN